MFPLTSSLTGLVSLLDPKLLCIFAIEVTSEFNKFDQKFLNLLKIEDSVFNS